MLETKNGEFYSINRRNNCYDEKQLKLRISCYNEDSIEIELTNQEYTHQRASKLKQIFGLVCCYILYRTLARTLTVNKNSAAFDIGIGSLSVASDTAFTVALICLIFSTTRLIKSEKLLLCLDFALQLQTERFCSRMSIVFIPYSDIYDVCINEVIENLDVHYILIMRTKGKLFDNKPIIPIFNTLKPSIDCLEVVYKHLQVILNKNHQ